MITINVSLKGYRDGRTGLFNWTPGMSISEVCPGEKLTEDQQRAIKEQANFLLELARDLLKDRIEDWEMRDMTRRDFTGRE